MSSNVKWISYFEELQVVLVKFQTTNSKPYAYCNVPVQIYDEFKQSESPGRFIKDTLINYRYSDSRYIQDVMKILISINNDKVRIED